jgi:hypothetical protein
MGITHMQPRATNKISVVPDELMYRANMVSVKLSTSFFTKLNKLILVGK